MTREEMLTKYETLTAADAYIIGFQMNGCLYTLYTETLASIADCIKYDRAAQSHGGMGKIRLRMTQLDKVKLARVAINRGPINVMEYAEKYNNGEKFERYITELNGQKWIKDNVPFWQSGDIEINGKQVQIKFDGAEITNEKTLARIA